uniref:Uncharacterized protein n=1 Tax=Anguilla anguilla TaxID=7936 RepID=A0A0E9S7U4_ANGAN
MGIKLNTVTDTHTLTHTPRTYQKSV